MGLVDATEGAAVAHRHCRYDVLNSVRVRAGKGGACDLRYGKYRCACLHRGQHHICPRYARGDEPSLVGAARDLRCAVVGIEGTLGEGLELDSDTSYDF